MNPLGFLPSARAGDGDPLDVILLTDYVMPVGSVVLAQLISVLQAEQIEDKKKGRNDRLIAIPVELASGKPMQPIVEFNSVLKRAIVDFLSNTMSFKAKHSARYATPVPTAPSKASARADFSPTT
jgi:inorganic pyrophosphatase